MSKETTQWLRQNIRIGYTSERGPAWWASSGEYMADGTHFDGPVPEGEVQRILDVPLVTARLIAQYDAPVLNSDGSVQRNDDGSVRTQREVREDPERQAIVTPDTGDILGVFKSGYMVHGYQQWTADQLARILDQSRGELGVASVGLLRNRGVAFLQAKLEGAGMEVGGYGFVPYITAATSVDGTLASTYMTGIEGVVCDNTLASAHASALTSLKVRHSRNSAGRISEVRSHLGLVYQAADEFTAAADALQNTPVSENEFALWMDEMTPVPDRDPRSSTGGRAYTSAVRARETYEALWTSDEKVKPWQGTAFGVLQLDNTYRTWDRAVKGADGGRMERNFLNMVTGKAAGEDNAALEKLGRVLNRELVAA